MSKVELTDAHVIRDIASRLMTADEVLNGAKYNFVDQLDVERAVKNFLDMLYIAGYTLYVKD